MRDYAREIVGRAPLPVGYPSTAPQLINHFIRDILVCKLINAVRARWPLVPMLYSSKQRRSAASLVGKCFALSEVQTRRVFLARREIAQKFIEFMDGYRRAPPSP